MQSRAAANKTLGTVKVFIYVILVQLNDLRAPSFAGRSNFNLPGFGHFVVPLGNISSDQIEDTFQWWNEHPRYVIRRVELGVTARDKRVLA